MALKELDYVGDIAPFHNPRTYVTPGVRYLKDELWVKPNFLSQDKIDTLVNIKDVFPTTTAGQRTKNWELDDLEFFEEELVDLFNGPVYNVKITMKEWKDFSRVHADGNNYDYTVYVPISFTKKTIDELDTTKRFGIFRARYGVYETVEDIQELYPNLMDMYFDTIINGTMWFNQKWYGQYFVFDSNQAANEYSEFGDHRVRNDLRGVIGLLDRDEDYVPPRVRDPLTGHIPDDIIKHLSICHFQNFTPGEAVVAKQTMLHCSSNWSGGYSQRTHLLISCNLTDRGKL